MDVGYQLDLLIEPVLHGITHLSLPIDRRSGTSWHDYAGTAATSGVIYCHYAGVLTCVDMGSSALLDLSKLRPAAAASSV